jgi:hypothetical protein
MAARLISRRIFMDL